MDYARQNYVAQPGDGVERFIRGIGPYDHYVIEWGYRVIPEAATPADERATLDRWIMDRAGDPRYLFGQQGYNLDPRNQTEDIGDDPVRASTYGIMNLKRVLPNLPDWTRSDVPGSDYGDLTELYGELVSSWSRYVGHVLTVVGGVHMTIRADHEPEPVYVPVDPDRQRDAVAFLAREVFDTPTWLNDPGVLARIEASGAVARIRQVQSTRLRQLLDPNRMLRMQEAELQAPVGGPRVYTPSELMADVRGAIWSELAGPRSIDPYRRNLQRVHVERLGELLGETASPSDAPALARAELVRLQREVRTAAGRSGIDALTRAHLEDTGARISALLEG
jgi:hypothetical protein